MLPVSVFTWGLGGRVGGLGAPGAMGEWGPGLFPRGSITEPKTSSNLGRLSCRNRLLGAALLTWQGGHRGQGLHLCRRPGLAPPKGTESSSAGSCVVSASVTTHVPSPLGPPCQPVPP